MSTLLDEPAVRPSTSPAQRLRTTMAAVRVSIAWFGIRKALNRQQQDQAADTFGAEGQFLSARKKLLDTKHPAYRGVSNIRNRIQCLWRAMTLPYPEPGIRLIRQDQVDAFNLQMSALQNDLQEAVWRLDEHYAELRSAARQRLGSLFDPADYPTSLRGLFRVEWDFPSIEPPEYLQQLNPALYQRECERVAARFDEALCLAEEVFISELSTLVTNLTERLTGQTDGKPKVFRDTVVTNLVEFFERFRSLNVRSNDQLDELVSQAQQIVHGVQPQALRDNHVLRQTVASELGDVQNVLDDLLVDRPRRNILRGPQPRREAA